MNRLALLFALVFAAPALAQTCTTEWVGPANGLFSEPANWTGGVPFAGAVGCIHGPGTSVVTLSTPGAAVTYGTVIVGGEEGDHTLDAMVDRTYAFTALLVRPTGTFVAHDGIYEGGIFENRGTVRIPRGTAQVPASPAFLEGSPVVNYGLFEVNALLGAWSFARPLVNEAGGTISIQGDPDERRGISNTLGGGNLRFVNRGLIASAGSGFGINSRNEFGCGPISPCFVNEGGRVESLSGELFISGATGGSRFEGGEYHAEAGALLYLTGAGAEFEGTLAGAPAGEVVFAAGASSQTTGAGAAFDFGGTGVILDTSLDGPGWRNVGLVNLKPTAFAGVTFTNEGTIRVLGTGSPFSGAASLWTNEAGAVMDFVGHPAANSSFGGPLTLVNRGLLVRSAGPANYGFSGAFVNETGGEIRNETGTFTFNDLTSEPGSVLAGTGTFTTGESHVPRGTIRPGLSPGILRWNTLETLQPETVLEIEIDGPEAGTDHDQLVFLSTVTLDGTLHVRLVEGYRPAVGTEFVVVEALSVAGNFTTADLPQGLSYEVNSENVTIVVTSPVEIEEAPGSAVPNTFALGAVYPNPFRETASFTLAVPAPGRVAATVYDLLGREVAVLVDGPLAAGEYRVTFEGRGLPSGVYLVRVVAGDAVATRRVTLVR